MTRTRIEIPRTAYPLVWPAGVARCSSRENARFNEKATRSRQVRDPQTGFVKTETWKQTIDVTISTAREGLLDELQRLGATEPVVISTNLRTRLDGLPAAGQPNPSDPGVAVYFVLDGRETCIAIDRYFDVIANIRAVAKTIEAMRGIERWGGASLVAAAFTGFQGLPGPGVIVPPTFDPWEVLGLDGDPNCVPAVTVEEARSQYRIALASEHPDKHPDDPQGAHERFLRVQEAWTMICAERPEFAA